MAVSLIDAAPETLLREEKFPKESGEGANERDLSLSILQFSIFTPPDIYIYYFYVRYLCTDDGSVNKLLIYGDVDRLGEAQSVRIFGRIKIERENFTIRKYIIDRFL